MADSFTTPSRSITSRPLLQSLEALLLHRYQCLPSLPGLYCRVWKLFCYTDTNAYHHSQAFTAESGSSSATQIPMLTITPRPLLQSLEALLLHRYQCLPSLPGLYCRVWKLFCYTDTNAYHHFQAFTAESGSSSATQIPMLTITSRPLLQSLEALMLHRYQCLPSLPGLYSRVWKLFCYTDTNAYHHSQAFTAESGSSSATQIQMLTITSRPLLQSLEALLLHRYQCLPSLPGLYCRVWKLFCYTDTNAYHHFQAFTAESGSSSATQIPMLTITPRPLLQSLEALLLHRYQCLPSLPGLYCRVWKLFCYTDTNAYHHSQAFTAESGSSSATQIPMLTITPRPLLQSLEALLLHRYQCLPSLPGLYCRVWKPESFLFEERVCPTMDFLL